MLARVIQWTCLELDLVLGQLVFCIHGDAIACAELEQLECHITSYYPPVCLDGGEHELVFMLCSHYRWFVCTCVRHRARRR